MEATRGREILKSWKWCDNRNVFIAEIGEVELEPLRGPTGLQGTGSCSSFEPGKCLCLKVTGVIEHQIEHNIGRQSKRTLENVLGMDASKE